MLDREMFEDFAKCQFKAIDMWEKHVIPCDVCESTDESEDVTLSGDMCTEGRILTEIVVKLTELAKFRGYSLYFQ